jgi:DNA replication licensing factor MCM2
MEKKELRIKRCAQCEGRGPFRTSTEKTIYRNYQKMTLQESPNKLEPGRLPRQKEVFIL